MHALRSAAAVVAMALLPALAAAATPATPTPATPTEHDRAYQLGLEAFIYGLPLLVTDATFQTMTSVTVPQGAFGPVNRFNHVRGMNTSTSTTVVAPGATGLSSIAWLDLTAGPQVLHVPEITDHHWMLALLDPWTETVALLGDAAGTTPGAYVIAGPGQQGAPIPAGAQRIDVDATRIWIIGSTQLNGPDDVAAVNAIQDGYTLAPLTPPPATAPTPEVTEVTRHTLPQGLAFFEELGRLLQAFPPPAADAPLLARLATVGIGPGRSPASDPTLSDATLQGLVDAVADGPAAIESDLQELVAASAAIHDGYLLGGFGRYGTDYTTRAVIATIGLGAVTPDEAIYAMTWRDATGAPLTGDAAYRIHLPAAPPTRAGWSLTVYDLRGRLVANDLGRSALTHRSPLATNADGSMEILLSATPPTDPAHLENWLPVPAGKGFEVMWRLFAPDPAAIDGILDGSGWQPPTVEPAPAS